MSIALCIGHSRMVGGHREGGALSLVPVTQEWNYNLDLARRIATTLHDTYGITAEIVSEYEGAGYSSAMRWLAARLRSLGAQLAVELHFNSADTPAARGHEWLHWHSSLKGRGLAASLSTAFTLAHTGIPTRGVKAIEAKQRGAEFLRLSHCPAVICEPFFGSNAVDWSIARNNPQLLADAIASGLSQAHSRL